VAFTLMGSMRVALKVAWRIPAGAGSFVQADLKRYPAGESPSVPREFPGIDPGYPFRGHCFPSSCGQPDCQSQECAIYP
jgi:hypothetical protein